MVGPTYRLDPAYGQWRWDDSRLAPFGNAADVPPMKYVTAQPPPGALPPRSPPPSGSGPPRSGTPIALRLWIKCQQYGHHAAQCTAHEHAHVAQNYPPISGSLARTLPRSTPVLHYTTEVDRPEHTMSPMELVATLRLAMLPSTLPQQHHRTPPRPFTPRIALEGQRNPRISVSRLMTHTFLQRRLLN